jgi:lysophospholipase L1-like esterase
MFSSHRFAVLIGFAFTSLCQAESSSTEDAPESMAALGDSISAGALALWNRADAHNPFVTGLALGDAMMFVSTNNYREAEYTEYSWAMGYAKGVDSHYNFLNQERKKQGLKGKVTGYLAALSGDTSGQMVQRQIPELTRWSRRVLHQDAPDYVTMLIGANNICTKTVEEMGNASDYYQDVAFAVDEILEHSPRSKIMISSLPDIEKLRGVAAKAKLTGKPGLKTCEDLWKTIQLCPTLTLESNPEKRKIVSHRVHEFNEVLRHIQKTRAEQYGDRVRLSENITQLSFTPDDLAIDCFHPNRMGQGRWARETWRNSWWSPTAVRQ